MLLLYVPSTTFFSFFFFNDTATTEIYTLSLHDALPISLRPWPMLLQRILPSSSSVPATTCGQPPLSAHGARPIESQPSAKGISPAARSLLRDGSRSPIDHNARRYRSICTSEMLRLWASVRLD